MYKCLNLTMMTSRPKRDELIKVEQKIEQTPDDVAQQISDADMYDDYY